MIELDLNANDCEALIRHCESFVPAGDDPRERRRLQDALETLREALESHLTEPTSSAKNMRAT
jgi:hypothetical protein